MFEETLGSGCRLEPPRFVVQVLEAISRAVGVCLVTRSASSCRARYGVCRCCNGSSIFEFIIVCSLADTRCNFGR